jgi:hypothetical protein
VSDLVQSSLQPSSIPTYKRAWKLFYQFLDNVLPGTPTTIPISPTNLALFIAYLYKKQYACSTVNTYVSALGYSHKLSGFVDPTKVFFVVQMLKGYGKIKLRLDCRLPITLPILHRIVQAVDSMSISLYDKSLFKAMCLFAFSTFSRIGEITATNAGNNIQLHQISRFLDNNNKVVSIKVQFLQFKHSYNQRPFSLTVSRQTSFCPVEHLLSYLQLRGYSGGPVFGRLDGSSVSRQFFHDKLVTALKVCNLDPDRYKGHSFRIGAASHAAQKGMSDGQIRAMGRWKSNAFLKYIRIPSLIH